MKHFGIIGYPLVQSFSAKYFNEKFTNEHIDAEYTLYPLENISLFPELVRTHDFTGMNVTIPYKQSVMQYLDEVDDTAKAVGAVNVIAFRNGKLIGYNSDTRGFRLDIQPLLQPHHQSALVLGTGGAAKAVVYALRLLGLQVHIVSRSIGYDFTYQQLTQEIIENHQVIVNCTPLGMFPNVDASPDIPYQFLTSQHLVYDVIYNPEQTLFLQKAKTQGATTHNGIGMLYGQALQAWEIWNE